MVKAGGSARVRLSRKISRRFCQLGARRHLTMLVASAAVISKETKRVVKKVRTHRSL